MSSYSQSSPGLGFAATPWQATDRACIHVQCQLLMSISTGLHSKTSSQDWGTILRNDSHPLCQSHGWLKLDLPGNWLSCIHEQFRGITFHITPHLHGCGSYKGLGCLWHTPPSYWLHFSLHTGSVGYLILYHTRQQVLTPGAGTSVTYRISKNFFPALRRDFRFIAAALVHYSLY